METKEDIQLMLMALKICGLEVSEPTLYLFLKVKEVYDQKKDSMSLYDACEIKAEIVSKYGGQHHSISVVIAK